MSGGLDYLGGSKTYLTLVLAGITQKAERLKRYDRCTFQQSPVVSLRLSWLLLIQDYIGGTCPCFHEVSFHQTSSAHMTVWKGT